MLLSTCQGQAKKKIFTSVVQGRSGTVVGHFPSVDQNIKETISQISHLMGPQVYYKLLKMGCKKEDIKRFTRKVFTAEQANNVTLSRYNKETGQAKVDEGPVDDIISAAAALGINTELGPTQSQKQTWSTTPGLSISETPVKAISVTTTHTQIEAKQGQLQRA